MSLWEFGCCMSGLAEFHGGSSEPAESSWTDDEARAIGIEGF